MNKDLVLAKQEKNSEYCLEDIEENLSDSTDGDGEEDSNNEDDEGPAKKETRAPLELMAEVSLCMCIVTGGIHTEMVKQDTVFSARGDESIRINYFKISLLFCGTTFPKPGT